MTALDLTNYLEQCHGLPAIPCSITLRDYQQEAIDCALEALRSGRAHVHVLSLPTGVGKTLVGSEVARRTRSANCESKVLWLAPRWDLLQHAASTLKAVMGADASLLARIGGDNEEIAGMLPDAFDAQVYLTTLQTWFRRFQSKTLPIDPKGHPLLVIHDECHWAVKAKIGRALRECYLPLASMLGLSATPVEDAVSHQIVYRKTYTDLCPQYLAKPIVRQVETGITWDPIVERGDFSPVSLADLGSREERNHLIVREVLRGANSGNYRKILIFACDVNHATNLNRLLSEAGVSSRTVHSCNTRRENDEAMRMFRGGTINVLVNVGMLAEGFDEPSIDAVFLARPTSSLRLLRQMAGRGSRPHSGKNSFWLVEFTDNVSRFHSQIFHADAFESSKPRSGTITLPRNPTHHQEPEEAPEFLHLHCPGLESVTYVKDQTFGVEIELSPATAIQGPFRPGTELWDGTAKRIINCLGRVATIPVHLHGLGYHERDQYTQWRVTYDSSCGWEVVSPILANAEGFEELRRVCDALTQLTRESKELCVNHKTGMHITLATRLDNESRLRGFIGRLTRLEAGLYTLVSPSRLYNALGKQCYDNRKRNRYAEPVREVQGGGQDISFSSLARCATRYSSVNLTRMDDSHRLLEVRMHHGTTEAWKIIPWIGLWMNIFNRSRYEWEGRPEFGRVFWGGNTAINWDKAQEEDIFRLLRNEGIILERDFEKLLRERRTELLRRWKFAVPRRVDSWLRHWPE